jgi:hypothetical protein
MKNGELWLHAHGHTASCHFATRPDGRQCLKQTFILEKESIITSAPLPGARLWCLLHGGAPRDRASLRRQQALEAAVFRHALRCNKLVVNEAARRIL